MMSAQLLFIGTTELMLIAGIALLLFGGKKLPEMMHGMGRGISEFKKGAKEVTEPFNEVKKEILSDVDEQGQIDESVK
jgi:sec-independent protein translocase protein TatA